MGTILTIFSLSFWIVSAGFPIELEHTFHKKTLSEFSEMDTP